MAYCGHCQRNIPSDLISNQEVVCPFCETPVRFNKKEYKTITRPGAYILVVFFVNIFFTDQPVRRLFINIALLALWFGFYLRFKRYLSEASMETVN